MRVAWLVLDAVGAAGAVTFIVMYAARSRGWHRSPIGRNMMAMAVCLAALLSMVLVQLAVRPPQVTWLILLGALDLVMWWRVVLLWRAQHLDRWPPTSGQPEAPGTRPTTPDRPTGRG